MASLTTTFETFANDAAVGTQSWGTESDAQSSNDVRVGMGSPAPTVGTTFTTNYIKCTGLTDKLPAGAEPTGIRFVVERRAAAGTPSYSRDYAVHLVLAGTIETGVNKADTGTNWPTSDGSVTYGSSVDLWGQAPTLSQVNASDFGMVLAVTHTSVSAEDPDAWPQIDQIKPTIDYIDHTVAGAASLTCAGVVASDDTIEYRAQAAPVGIAVVNAHGTLDASSQADLVGAGVLTASGTLFKRGITVLNCIGVVEADEYSRTSGVANLVGTATVSAEAEDFERGQANLVGTATIYAMHDTRISNLVGRAVISARGWVRVLGEADLVASAALGAEAVTVAAGQANLSGEAYVSASGTGGTSVDPPGMGTAFRRLVLTANHN